MAIGVIDLGNLSSFNVYLALALNGIFTGLGVAIGSYLANKHIIERGQKIVKKIKKIKNK